MANEVSRQWCGKSRGGRFGYRFFIVSIRLLGIRFAYFFLSLIVIYFIPFAPKATWAIWIYNRRRRGLGVMRSVCELYAHYYVFGQTLIDRLAMRSGFADRYHYQFDNYTRFLEVLNSGQGVVMIGAHVGCWEAGAAFFGHYGKKINIVMFDAEHQQIKEVIEADTELASDYKIIAVNQNAIEAMIQIKVALNGGEYICFNGDRFVDVAGTHEVMLLGAPASLPLGPFRIAAKCGVPVVFYYAMRESRRSYRFIFEEPVSGPVLKEGELLEQYAHSLEELLARYPRQWFNFYDFWNDRAA